MTKSKLLLLLLCLVGIAVFGSAAWCRNHTEGQTAVRGERLMVKNLSAGQDITEHTWGVIKVEVAVEGGGEVKIGRKQRIERKPLKVKVNNRETDCSILESSTRREHGRLRTFKTIGVRVGGPPGPRNINIMYNGKSSGMNVNYRPVSRIEFCNLYERQGIFGKREINLDWLACYVSKESVKVLINGKEMATKLSVLQDTPEIIEGRLKLAARDLRAGPNTVKVSATDIYGERREIKRVFYNYSLNRVRVGDTFVLCLGMEEPKGGPFYDAVVEGEAIVRKESLKLTPLPERMAGTTVVQPGRIAAVVMEAVRPGRSTIRAEERQGITDTSYETQKLVLTVTDSSEDSHGEPGVVETQPYIAAGLFRSELPKGWTKAVDSGRGRGVYRVSAYEGKREDRLALKETIEYYAPENRTGYKTVEDYAAGLVKSGYRPKRVGGLDVIVGGRKAKAFEREMSIVAKTKIFFSNRVAVMERSVVVPAASGFYVLEFRTPVSELQKNQEIFDILLGSFEPLK